ncbi:MAG: ABC transporter ATP-binding protein [Bacteroides sp.]|nr:ABC transporter ATP-binding protein [Bacteroides sp.]
MLQTKNLSKTFRTDEIETVALNGINLDIADGEFIAIMGPSGCGKSTLLNILGLLDNPSGGQYFFEGTEVAGLREKQRGQLRKGRIGFVFQSFNLIDEIDVAHNVELPLTYLGLNRVERRKRVDEMLAKVNMSHRAHHLPQQLSGGQQQRVAIARALVTRPSIILADEPTGNLDSHNGLEIMELLAELNREGTTIVMVTHSDRDAAYASRIIHLFDGSIVGEVHEKV